MSKTCIDSPKWTGEDRSRKKSAKKSFPGNPSRRDASKKNGRTSCLDKLQFSEGEDREERWARSVMAPAKLLHTPW